MSKFLRSLTKEFIVRLRSKGAEYLIAAGLIALYLFLSRLRAYLVSYYGNEIGAITDRFYRIAYDVAFFSFVVSVCLFFLWAVLERKNKIFLAAGCLAIGMLAAYQFFYISKDTIYGDLSARQNLLIDPRYKYMRIENNEYTRQFKAPGRLSPDFAQVYFPAHKRQPLEDAYTSNTKDPWGRQSRYPPLFHYICSLTYCNLDYGPASFVNLILQLVLFIAAYIYAFIRLNLKTDLIPNLILLGFCLFLTPVGLAWFERGQFTLYVGLAYLCLLLGLMQRSWFWIVLSAIFSYIKWTSFPYTFTILAVFLVTSPTRDDLKQGLLLAGLYGTVILLLFVSFLKAGIIFIDGLLLQELSFEPAGVNLAYFLPVYVVKLLPAFLVLLGWILLKRKGFQDQIPFFVSAAILMSAYPTLAYDYNLPSLMVFVPFLIYWSKLPETSIKVGKLELYIFYGFLVAASFSIRLFVTETVLTVFYILTACTFLIGYFIRVPAASSSRKSVAATT